MKFPLIIEGVSLKWWALTIIPVQLLLSLSCSLIRVKYGFLLSLLSSLVYNVMIFALVYNTPVFAKNSNRYLRSDQIQKTAELMSNLPHRYVTFMSRYPDMKGYKMDLSFSDNSKKTKMWKKGRVYSCKNVSFEKLFRDLSGASRTLIVYDNPQTKSIYFDIKVVLPKNRPQYKIIHATIIRQILKKIDQKATYYKIKGPSEILFIENIDKFNQNVVLDPTKVNDTKNYMVIKNASLEKLANKIEIIYDLDCVTLNVMSNVNDYVIPKNNLNELKSYLSDNYGIQLKTEEYDRTLLYVHDPIKF
ncbi:hypothetical protein K5X82_01700 [Halosquirtibacter xylanolyticus]|uniref:hypothetical protein n=1 Tax=Halosquirtibacter xylanolyticus TaxID=3374599 RepID=UPI0037493325|nr:hypothetical protein K5X82_01700 [Prolixibacteraceae bacterium]